MLLRFAICCCCAFSLVLDAQTDRPNIIFILADDLGYADLGCYGNPYHRTPSLDRLASSGMRFTQAYVASPICSPSRAAIMTAKHPARLQLTNYLVGLRTDPESPLLPAPFRHFLPAQEETLAEMLSAQGYSCGMVGKWHLGEGPGISAHQQGFQYTRQISKNGLDYYNYAIASNGKEIFADSGKHYITDKLTDYGLEFIESNQEKPFFLYLAYSAPHVLIVPRGDKLRSYLFNYNKFDGKFNPYYAAVIESLDDGVGRILDKLKELGLSENTLVVFTSDNGGLGVDELGPTPTVNTPLRGWKGDVYEGGTRVPMIAAWPGRIPAGTANHHYITGTDYLPTFMDIIGQRMLPDSLDGMSFYETLLHQEAAFDRGPVFWHYPHFSNQKTRPAAAVRAGDFKLVERYETGKLELYNLAIDVGESREIGDYFPEKRKELHELLVDWRRAVNANMPLPNPDYVEK